MGSAPPTMESAGDGIFRRPLMPVATHVLGQMTYLGDVANPIEVAHCGQFFPRMAAVAEVVLLAAKACGLTVNWSAGKTEAVVGLHGAGLAEARKELAAMEVLQEDGRPLPLLPFPGATRPFGAPVLPRLRPPCRSGSSATTASQSRTARMLPLRAFARGSFMGQALGWNYRLLS